MLARLLRPILILVLVASCAPAHPPSAATATPSGVASGTDVPASDGPSSSQETPAWAVIPSLPLDHEALARREEDLQTSAIEAGGVARALGPEATAWLRARMRDFVGSLPGRTAATEPVRQAPLTESLSLSADVNAASGMADVVAGPVGAAMVSMMRVVEQTDGTPGTIGPTTANESGTFERAGRRTSVQMTMTQTITVSGCTVHVEAEHRVVVAVADIASGATVERATLMSEGKVEITYCPDIAGVAPGRVEISLDSTSDGTAGSTTFSLTITGEVKCLVSDAARLTKVWIDTSVEKSDGGRAYGVEMTAGYGYGGDEAGPVDVVAGSAGEHRSPGTSRADLDQAYKDGGLAMLIALMAMPAAEDKWRSGACVAIDTGDEHGGIVDPGSRVTISAKPTHKFDHVDLDKPVVALLVGDAALDPADEAREPPATFVYTAPSEAGATGVVTITSTSNRGIGTTTLTFAAGDTWLIEGTVEGWGDAGPGQRSYEATMEFSVTVRPLSTSVTPFYDQPAFGPGDFYGVGRLSVGVSAWGYSAMGRVVCESGLQRSEGDVAMYARDTGEGFDVSLLVIDAPKVLCKAVDAVCFVDGRDYCTDDFPAASFGTRVHFSLPRDDGAEIETSDAVAIVGWYAETAESTWVVTIRRAT